MNCCSSSYHGLAYWSIITLLLKKQKIPLNGEIVPNKVLTRKILGKKGFDISSYFLKFNELRVPDEKKMLENKNRKIGGTSTNVAMIESLDNQ